MMIAKTRMTWIHPLKVYVVTTPMSHSTIKIIPIVVNMFLLKPLNFKTIAQKTNNTCQLQVHIL